jgi:hypothetical protein
MAANQHRCHSRSVGANPQKLPPGHGEPGTVAATLILGIFPGRILAMAQAGAATFAAVGESAQR